MAEQNDELKLFLMLTVKAGEAIFFEDDESEEDESGEASPRFHQVKVMDYAERTVPQMFDLHFKMHFRLSRKTFETLMMNLSPILQSILGKRFEN